jgi:hypothetical protein
MKNEIKKCCNHAGFTLIELLTYLSLAAVVFLGLDYLFLRSTDIYVDVLSSSTLAQSAHTASEMLEREIKGVQNKNSVIIATSTQFKFTNTSNSVIDLVYAGEQIKKNTIVYGSGITSFSFSYYKWDGTTWTSASPSSQIAKIRFVFTMSIQGHNISKDLYVLLRNMR